MNRFIKIFWMKSFFSKMVPSLYFAALAALMTNISLQLWEKKSNIKKKWFPRNEVTCAVVAMILIWLTLYH